MLGGRHVSPLLVRVVPGRDRQKLLHWKLIQSLLRDATVASVGRVEGPAEHGQPREGRLGWL
jgi:hypothetical protein